MRIIEINKVLFDERIKSYKLEQLRTQEELAKQKKIEELEAEIRAVEMAIEPYRDISLINVEATHELYGTGIVIEQNINKVKVKFSDCEKTFEIHKKYSKRPIFEDDKDIVEAFSVYGDGTARINRLKEQLRLL